MKNSFMKTKKIDINTLFRNAISLSLFLMLFVSSGQSQIISDWKLNTQFKESFKECESAIDIEKGLCSIALVSENISKIILFDITKPNMCLLEIIDTFELQNFLFFAILILIIISAFYIYHFYKLKKESIRTTNLENELDQRNDEYARVFNSLQDVYYRSDINGIVVSVSPSVFALSGYEAKDVIGLHESSFYDDRSLWGPFRKDLIAKGAVNDRLLMLKNANSKPVAVSVTAKVIYDSNNNITGFEGVLRDVSLTILNENKLKASEQKLKLATEISNLGISEYNPQSGEFVINDVLSKIVFENDKSTKINVTQLSNLIHQDDLHRLIDGYNRIISSSISEFEIEFRIVGVKGDFVWFKSKFIKLQATKELDSEIILGIHLYIDDLKSALISARQNQRILEAIYNSVEIMLIVVDEKLNIREVNNTVSTETEMLKEHIVGNRLGYIFKDLYENELESIVLSSLESKENIYNREISCKLANSITDSDNCFYNVSTAIFFVDDDLRILVSIVDITDRKKYETESERTRILIEENSKLKSDFISNLSFEIRTPINAIMGFVSLLKSRSVSAEQKEKYVEIIRDSSDNLLKIVENVIELSKAEFHELDIRKTEFDIVTLVRNIGEAYFDKIKEKNIEFVLKIDIPEDKTILNSDILKIRTVLGHFLENSIKYTESGVITVGLNIKEARLWLYISDTGIGIENPDMIFTTSLEEAKPTFDNHLKNHGMGISLRICKAYIEALGGELFIESTLGSGSKFSFYLPFEEAAIEKEIIKKEKTVKAKILIVEDEDYNYEYLSQILEMEGYDFIVADDGQKAIDAVKENVDIDIILMDIRLPGINGLEAAKIIKSICPKIPIIAQTAYDFNTEEEKLIEEYCEDYIQKPIVSKILLNKIEKLLPI